LHFSLRRYSVQAHATHTDIEVKIAIKRHAQRRSANMGKHFHLLVIWREKTNDVAMTRTSVQMVVAVQDHVLRAFDPTQANELNISQLVVDGPDASSFSATVWRDP